MEASTNEEVEIDNRAADVIWKLEENQEPEDEDGCEKPSEEGAVLSDDDDDDADEPDSEHEVVVYQSGYLQNDDQNSEEPPAEKRSRFQYEADPRTRKRHCKKLLQRLKHILDELSARVGQQVAIIVAQPPNASVRHIQTYGSNPLQEVVKRYHPTILSYLSEALAKTEPQKPVDPSRFELPPLMMEGVPIPLDKMTQAQLREFIPLMIRYSTGRGKPGWGLERTRPPWWPIDVPWQNIRLDPRDADSKARESWSDTLRRIIIACYKYHDREDLLREASGSYEEPSGPSQTLEESSDSSSSSPLILVKPDVDAETPGTTSSGPHEAVTYSQVVNSDGTISLYMPKEGAHTETRQVILTDTEGREYCVQIAVPAGQASVLGNFQVAQPEQTQEMPVVNGHVVGLSN